MVTARKPRPPLPMWANPILATHYSKSTSLLLSFAVIVPNTIIGLLMAKVANLPLKHMFETPRGRVCWVGSWLRG